MCKYDRHYQLILNKPDLYSFICRRLRTIERFDLICYTMSKRVQNLCLTVVNLSYVVPQKSEL